MAGMQVHFPREDSAVEMLADLLELGNPQNNLLTCVANRPLGRGRCSKPIEHPHSIAIWAILLRITRLTTTWELQLELEILAHRLTCDNEHHRAQEVAIAKRWLDILADSANQMYCGICRDDFTNALRTPCGHYFCRGCIKGWLRRVQEVASPATCPLCRTQLAVDHKGRMSKADPTSKLESQSFWLTRQLRYWFELTPRKASIVDAVLERSGLIFAVLIIGGLLLQGYGRE